jgi:hypothetical protein
MLGFNHFAERDQPRKDGSRFRPIIENLKVGPRGKRRSLQVAVRTERWSFRDISIYGNATSRGVPSLGGSRAQTRPLVLQSAQESCGWYRIDTAFGNRP